MSTSTRCSGLSGDVLIHVYTGDGKGKTTAALGLALRASGHGRRILVIQFMKGKIDYGELASSKKLGTVEIIQFGRPDFVDLKNPSQEDRDLAREAFAFACEVLHSGKYDMIILDEINVALAAHLIPVEEAIELLRAIPENIELVLTGRWAPEKILAEADYVTEMREIKHPFKRGIVGRKGVEW